MLYVTIKLVLYMMGKFSTIKNMSWKMRGQTQKNRKKQKGMINWQAIQRQAHCLKMYIWSKI